MSQESWLLVVEPGSAASVKVTGGQFLPQYDELSRVEALYLLYRVVLRI